METTHIVYLGDYRVARGNGVEQVAVGRRHPHRRVRAPLHRGAVAVRGGVVQRERVVALAAQIVGPEGALQLAAPALLPHKGGREVAEAAALRAGFYLGVLARPEPGLGGLHVEGIAGGVCARWEQRCLLLPLAEAHVGRVAQQVAPQVHLAVLRVVDGHSVQRHRRELASQAARRHRLDASHAAVVLQRHTSHLLHGVAQQHGPLGLYLLHVHHLCRRRRVHRRGGTLRAHLHLVEGAHRVLRRQA